MRRIGELGLEDLFAGSRMLQGMLLAESYVTGRPPIASLRKRMGIEALYRRPNASKPAAGHGTFPICHASCRRRGGLCILRLPSTGSAAKQTFFQSIPSTRARSWAWFRRTRDNDTGSLQNCVVSIVLAKRNTPLPSRQTNFTQPALLDLNT